MTASVKESCRIIVWSLKTVNSPSFLAPAWIQSRFPSARTRVMPGHVPDDAARHVSLGNTDLRPNSWPTLRREKESSPRLQKIIQSNFELDSVTVFTRDTKCLFEPKQEHSIWRNKESLWTLDYCHLLKSKTSTTA